MRILTLIALSGGITGTLILFFTLLFFNGFSYNEFIIIIIAIIDCFTLCQAPRQALYPIPSISHLILKTTLGQWYLIDEKQRCAEVKALVLLSDY